MKLLNKYKLPILIVSIVVFVIPHFAHASVIEFIDRTVFYMFLNTFAEFAKQLASVFLASCAAIMDVSLNITMQIKQFVDSIPAVYTVWKAIRDLSGIAIIFTLVWVALQMILNLKSPNFSNVIKNVVMAGFLINFSFFIVGFLIDVSNVTSLQIYKQMLPGTSAIEVQRAGKGANFMEATRVVFDEGGISSIFMNIFKFQKLDGTNVVKSSTDGVDATPVNIKIFITSISGAIMMVTTGLSFLLAAVACIARLAILIFILAFSPLYFVGFIVPDIKKQSASLLSMFTGQLLFMPVYLLLMYLALQVVSTFNVYATTNSDSAIFGIVTLAANCVFVIIMLNVPLIAALQFGAVAPNFMKNNFDSFKIWNNFGKKLGGGIQSFSKYSAQGISRNTIGYAANKLANNDSLKNMASRSVLAGMALKGLRNTAKPYAENRDKAVQERTKFAESLGGDMSKVRFHEEEIRDLRQQQQQYYDNGQFDDAKALDKKIQEIRKLRDTAKLEAVRERKEAYARRQSIWLKLNGANAEAASKIQNEVISKRLEEANKDLDKIKSDAKEKRNILDKLVTSQEAQIARGGNLSDDQKARKAKLEDEIKVIEEKLKGANAKVLDLEDQLSKV
jgi:hypothetical protein